MQETPKITSLMPISGNLQPQEAKVAFKEPGHMNLVKYPRT